MLKKCHPLDLCIAEVPTAKITTITQLQGIIMYMDRLLLQNSFSLHLVYVLF